MWFNSLPAQTGKLDIRPDAPRKKGLPDWDRFLDAREMEAPTGLWRRGLFDYLV